MWHLIQENDQGIVWPPCDLIKHWVRDESCPCKPKVETVIKNMQVQGYMLVHNALDGRE